MVLGFNSTTTMSRAGLPGVISLAQSGLAELGIVGKALFFIILRLL
jgi:hypothetical protein